MNVEAFLISLFVDLERARKFAKEHDGRLDGYWYGVLDTYAKILSTFSITDKTIVGMYAGYGIDYSDRLKCMGES